MPKRKSPTDAVLAELRAFGLAYPRAHTKSPWPGHLDLAVKNKTFAYLGVDGEPISISCKLPHSNREALLLPFTKPTAYGLGKSGWVTATFGPGEIPPIGMLKRWIDESYRAQASQRLVARHDAAMAASAVAPVPTGAKKSKAPATRKPAAKRKAATKAKPAAKRKAAAKRTPAKQRA
jgi:hypothetical protein